jgi:uncharacterized protein (TIGR03083 family)
MTDRADQMIKALRTGHDELAALVGGFTADDLIRGSGASQWDISQVLSHLGSGAEIGLATLEAALDATDAPGQEFNQGVWARWDAMSPAERAEGFVRANETLVRRYEDLDAPTRERLRIDFGFLPAPVDVASAAGLRLSEFAYHAWDVKVGFDPAATLAPEATELLIDQAGMLIGFIGQAGNLAGRPVTIAVRITSPQRALGLDVRDAVALVEAPDQPDGELTAPAEWWLRLVAGRHAPEHTPAGVRLTGSVGLDDLRKVFPGY